jgi:SAM-dependent methyltransferase
MTDLNNKETAIEFYEDRYEQGYMEEWDELKKQKVKEVLLSLSLPEKGKALDFGCGNGVFTKVIKNVLPHWEVYGVEISKTAINNAAVKNPDCIFFSASETEAYQHQFDFLFSHHVIEHVQDLNETFDIINSYLKPESSQLHILPCGNTGSFEYEITSLKKNGIEKEKGNRFFYEEPGHLRRLTTDEFTKFENKLGFTLQDEFYSNQKDGAINWITKSSPRFVKKLTSLIDAKDKEAEKKLSALKRKLLPLTYLQFPYSKFFELSTKWNKRISDYLFLTILFIPSRISLLFYKAWDKKAVDEWESSKKNNKGSEMFLFFKR